MKARILISNACRRIARIFTILVFVLGIPLLLFAGVALVSGGAVNLAELLNWLLDSLPLVGMLVGFAIAWRKEGVGATIALTTLVGSLIRSGGISPGVGIRQGFPLLEYQLHWLFALSIPGYHLDASPSAKWVRVISWILPIVPILFFCLSLLIRRRIPESQYGERSIPQEDDEKLKCEAEERRWCHGTDYP